MLIRLPRLAGLAERVRLAGVALDYEIQSGHYQSSQRVLSTLDELARLESTPWYIIDRIRRQYKQKYESARSELDRIADQDPEFINDLQERMGQKLLLLAKAESIRQQAERGTLSNELAEASLREISSELRHLKRYRAARLKLEPAELLRRWPPFEGLTPQDLASIAMRLRPQPLRQRETVTRQGDRGESMYFIAHGVVRLSREDNGAERDVATFVAGDFFGEDALLGGKPYSATATAVTPCSLYRLERMDLDVAIANSPIIREALEKNHPSASGDMNRENRRSSK